jgi:hypothetical protein
MMTISFALLSCKTLSQQEQIRQTMYSVLSAINKNDTQAVKRYFYEPTRRRYPSDEQLKLDLETMYYLLAKYHANNIDSLEWSTDNKHDNLSRLRVVIPIFDGFDSLSGITKATLNLYFGPEEIVPLAYISGYDQDIQVDAVYRGELMKQGKLPDNAALIESLKKR